MATPTATDPVRPIADDDGEQDQSASTTTDPVLSATPTAPGPFWQIKEQRDPALAPTPNAHPEVNIAEQLDQAPALRTNGKNASLGGPLSEHDYGPPKRPRLCASEVRLAHSALF